MSQVCVKFITWTTVSSKVGELGESFIRMTQQNPKDLNPVNLSQP